MSEISTTFRDKFTKAFEASEFKSFRQLSLQANCSEPQVHQIVRGKFDGSKAGPGIFTFYRLAQALGRSIDSFLDDEIVAAPNDVNVFNDTQGRDPAGFDALMATHWRSGGRLDAFDSLSDHFDLYEAPTDAAFYPIVYQLGPKGLFSLRLQSTDIRLAQRELNRLPAQIARQTLQFHQKVFEHGIYTENTFLDHQLHTKPVHVRAGYSKLGLRVEHSNGRHLILIACKPIPV